MTPSKPWYASAGVWGALVTLAGSVLALLKVELDPALLEDVRQWVLQLATLVGGAVALWGRIRASRKIGSPPSAGGPPTLPEPTNGWRMMLLLGVGVVALAAASSTGCAALDAPAGAYVAADRATYDAVAPEYGAYVATDATLSVEQRERRARTLELWRLRLEDAEGRAAREGSSGVVAPVAPIVPAVTGASASSSASPARTAPPGRTASPPPIADRGPQADRLNGGVRDVRRVLPASTPLTPLTTDH